MKTTMPQFNVPALTNKKNIQTTIIGIKNEALENADKMKNTIKSQQPPLEIVGEYKAHLSKDFGAQHYDGIKDKPYFKDAVDNVTKGDTIWLAVKGQDAIGRGRIIVKEEFRPKYGIDGTQNGAHASDPIVENDDLKKGIPADINDANRELGLHFPGLPKNKPLDIQA